MTVTINRRDFIKYAGGGLAALVVGNRLGWVFQSPQYAAAAVQTIELHIGDAIKQMVTHNSINNAECYFWVYKSVVPNLAAEVPGPVIFATKGDTVTITVTNLLDEPHAFFIPGIPGADTGAIPPVQNAPANVRTISFTASVSGAHLYFDNLNAPVNRMMGLHGAMIVMPVEADRTPGGHNQTPYGGLAANHGVQKLFDDFGNFAPGTALTTKQARATPTHFPGLAWEEGDPAADSFAPPFRTYIWLDHQASPVLFAEVGNHTAGQDFPAQLFLDRFLRDPFSPTPEGSHLAQYFTIDGQSGHFSHNNPHICPNLRVGEPCVVHILNPGLWIHSMHLHANHFYVTVIDGVVQENPLWLDVFEVKPMQRIDYVVPYVRPPDVPNEGGIGLPVKPLTTLANALIPNSAPHPAWPPSEEITFAIPAFSIPAQTPPNVIAPAGVAPLTAQNQQGATIDLGVQLSPLCFPMHDHSEPSQTSQGGNYNLGLISGMNFTGDRNIVAQDPGFVLGPGQTRAANDVVTFPNNPNEVPPNVTGPAAPPHVP